MQFEGRSRSAVRHAASTESAPDWHVATVPVIQSRADIAGADRKKSRVSATDRPQESIRLRRNYGDIERVIGRSKFLRQDFLQAMPHSSPVGLGSAVTTSAGMATEMLGREKMLRDCSPREFCVFDRSCSSESRRADCWRTPAEEASPLFCERQPCDLG